MISAIQMRKGNVIIYKGSPHRVLDRQHRTPGKGAAIIRARLRNLKSGASYEVRFNSQESVEQVSVEQHQMEYLYTDGTHFHFMNTHNYEQVAEILHLGEKAYFLVTDPDQDVSDERDKIKITIQP